MMASGLTLVFGLMDVMNFAHGVFISVGAYAAVSVLPMGAGWQDGWEVETGGNTLSKNEPAPHLVLSGPMAGVSYLPNGRLSSPGFVLFTVSATTGYTRCVVIDPGGRATLNPGERNDGSCV